MIPRILVLALLLSAGIMKADDSPPPDTVGIEYLGHVGIGGLGPHPGDALLLRPTGPYRSFSSQPPGRFAVADLWTAGRSRSTANRSTAPTTGISI